MRYLVIAVRVVLYDRLHAIPEEQTKHPLLIFVS